jgi:VWFA-related protein
MTATHEYRDRRRPRMTIIRVVVEFFVIAFVAGTSAPLRADQSVPFRGRVDAVELNVVVTSDGKPARDLTAADFRVTDNGIVQPLVDVIRETTPMDVIVAVDTSQHLSPHLVPDVRRAVSRIRGRLRPIDQLSLVTFDERLHEQTAPSMPSKAGDIEIGTPSGREALYDVLGALLARPWQPGRRQVIVLFTDGFDNASQLTELDVLAAAERSHAIVIVILRDASDANWRGALPGEVRAHGQPLAFFHELTAATGGLALAVPGAPLARPKPNALASVINHALVDETAVELLDDIRTSYFVRYQLTGVAPGGRHEVSVSIARRDGDYVARTRTGYLAVE